MLDDNYNEYESLLSKSNNIELQIKEILNTNINFSNEVYPILLGYLIGYFSSKNKKELSQKDIKEILYNYQKENFEGQSFQQIFSTIAFIFCQQYISINNNNNNFISNQNQNLNLNNSFNPIDSNNFPIFNNQNRNNNNFQNSIFSNNNFQSQNNQNRNNYYQNFQNSNNQNRNNFQDLQNSYNQNIQFNNFPFKNDEEFAKMLEEEERIRFNKEQENNKQLKKCEICLEDFSLLDSNNYFLTCNCTIHDKCFDDYIKSQVEQNNLPIKCPSCGKEVHPNFIQDSLNSNQELLKKYFKFSMNKFLNEYNNEYSSCPTPGCEYAFFFNQGEYHFRCPLCNKEYCLNCKDEWHKNLTCEEYRDRKDVNKLDKQFMEFVKGAKFKMCPKCKFWVEKNQGCNHMKCRCGADFCYLCGKLMDMSRNHHCKK